MLSGSFKDAAQELLCRIPCLEGLHASQPGPEAHAQALYSAPATQQPELSLYHLAKQHPSHEGPPVHDCSQHCAMEIRVCTIMFTVIMVMCQAVCENAYTKQQQLATTSVAVLRQPLLEGPVASRLSLRA